MSTRHGLGRGFESLIPTELVEAEFDATRDEDQKVSQLLEIPLDQISRDESQPRKDFNPEALEALASSVKEHGVLQPIVVTQSESGYQIVAGERRWRAAKLAGLTTIPAIVRSVSAQNRLELSVIENAQREDLNPIELATAYKKLETQFNLTPQDIADRIGKSKTTIVNTMRLLSLPEEAKKAMVEHHLTEGVMRPLIKADKDLILKILPVIIEEGWTARKVESYIATHKDRSSHVVVRDNHYFHEEESLAARWGTPVTISPRRITFSCKNETELRALLEKLS